MASSIRINKRYKYYSSANTASCQSKKKDGNIKIFENEVNGIIIDKIRCEIGFMIDRLVISNSLNCTIAELNYENPIEFWSKNSNFFKFREWIEKNQ